LLGQVWEAKGSMNMMTLQTPGHELLDPSSDLAYKVRCKPPAHR
jgi:hypothetical protein